MTKDTFLGFKQLSISNLLIESIKPDAEFLFVNLNKLVFEPVHTFYGSHFEYPIEALISNIGMFNANARKLDYIKINLRNNQSTFDKLDQLAVYPIKSLKLTSFYDEKKNANKQVNENNQHKSEDSKDKVDDKKEDNDDKETQSDNEEEASEDEDDESDFSEDESDEDDETDHTQVHLVPLIQKIAAHLKDLIEIQVSSNETNLIEEEAFKSFANLETLNLSGGQLVSVRPRLFSNITKLSTLTLSNNNFESLPENFLDGLISLKCLNMSKSSKLKEIHPLAFNRLVSLEELDLSECAQLSQLSKLPNWPATLKVLSLSQSNLAKIASHSFCNIANLEKLDLSVNKLAEFELIGCAPKIIDLSRNKLTAFKLTMSDDLLSRIEQLNLSKNDLSSLDLDKLSNLNVLDLTNNNQKLRSLNLSKCSPRVLLAGMNHMKDLVLNGTNIECLDLSNNCLRNSFKLVFRSDFSRLTELTLASNGINSLDWGVFNRMPSLVKLSVAENSISQLHAEAFRGLQHLQALSISITWLECLKPDQFQGLFKLKRLELTRRMGNFIVLNSHELIYY